jgi:hypothetical protein
MTASYCTGEQVSCNVADYTAQAVPFTLLDAGASPITAALSARIPNGLTPTTVALQGALAAAKAQASANPTHTVAMLLITDGEPSPDDGGTGSVPAACGDNPTAVVASGLPAIKTFVIGVFASADLSTGLPSVNAIASAGGTGQAIVIQTNTNVSQAFLQALNTVRGSALPCDYALPIPDAGTPDFGKLNVQYTPTAATPVTVGYVESAARCDATKGGWYYNADPAEGGIPTEIQMCPATCAEFKADTGGRVDIVLGCATVVEVH